MTQQPPLSILLADDDTDDRYFFAKALKEITIDTHLTTLNDGEELMDYLYANVQNLPDVLFLDLSMPRKSGFECLAEIKEDPRLKDLPIVMFSTSFPRDKTYEQGMIKMLFSIGAWEFIRKPDDFETLKTVVKNALIRLIDDRNNLINL